jgi:predicted nucleic acid-binding protein
MGSVNVASPVSVADALQGIVRIGLDTAPIIYFVEGNPDFFPACEAVFQLIAGGGLTAVTSHLTLTETLPLPIRNADIVLENAYRSLLLSSVGIETFPIDEPVAARAAGLRARYGLRTPDALQIATAIEHGCQAFLTGDRKLRQVSDISVVVIGDLTP